jgi:valyl-tRNA synthetase
MVDPKFGTGAVKITPAHDVNDFEVGKRHNLPSIKVIGEDARMTAAAGPYAGLDRFEARRRVLAGLQAAGELVKTEDYTVSISKCDRSKSIVEPLVSTQWFMRMKPLAAKAMEAVRGGQVKFVPDDRENLFFQWMENIRDWCISRQLWWGHRIPAWYCHHCSKITVARETPAVCPNCQSTELEQDSDVLDTWFSSGLWPFSTLGWPDDTPDLRAFYPTSLLITGFDILFFWLSRMIMLGIEMTGEVPFREVHIHGLVRDADKQKMSKTRGNVIDPLVIMDQYGTDACRIALLISASAGADIALKEDRMASGRAFANKIWNASRWLFMNMERSGIAKWSLEKGAFARTPEDAWIRTRLNECTKTVNESLALHRYHEAGQTLWDFVWHDFCDWYLEVKKLRFEENSGQDDHWTETLAVYESSLRLLHPVMPFLTEELWQRLMTDCTTEHAVSISLAAFPQPFREPEDQLRASDFVRLQELVKAARAIRADNKIDPKAVLDTSLTFHASPLPEEDLITVGALAKLNFKSNGDVPSNLKAHLRATQDFDLRIFVPKTTATDATLTPEARARIEKDNSNLERNISNSERQLGDEAFLSKAPAKVIATLRAKLAEYKRQLEKNKDLLESGT